MSTVRVVSFKALRVRLGSVLGVGSPIFVQFARALDSRDEAELHAAIEALDACPEVTRQWSGPLGPDRDQAAVLTAGRVLYASNCSGLR